MQDAAGGNAIEVGERCPNFTVIDNDQEEFILHVRFTLFADMHLSLAPQARGASAACCFARYGTLAPGTLHTRQAVSIRIIILAKACVLTLLSLTVTTLSDPVWLLHALRQHAATRQKQDVTLRGPSQC